MDIRKGLIVIGASAGGIQAIEALLTRLPEGYFLPVIVVLHMRKNSSGFGFTFLQERISLNLKEGEEKDELLPGMVYFAPPDYHLLVERNMTISLSTDERVNYSRPSIDVLFESAVMCCGESTVGVLLTGANEDGAAGLKRIQEAGGLVFVQDPESAEAKVMPEAALRMTVPDFIGTPEMIGEKLAVLEEENEIS